MTDWPLVPPAPAPPPATVLPKQAASMVAILAAVGSLITTWQGYEGGRETQRAAYEALRQRSELQGKQLEDLVRAQAEIRDWMGDASRKLDERTSNTERVLRKVAKPRQVAPPLLPPEHTPPTSPPPPVAAVKPPEPLPPFDALPK